MRASLSIKPGKDRTLKYLCSFAVNTTKGIVSHVEADFADSRDSLPRLLAGLQRLLRAQELRVRDLLADAGYANGLNFAYLEAEQVTAWIPVFGQFKTDIEDFTYDAAQDIYNYQAGKTLPFCKYDTMADGTWLKIYWATCQYCQRFALKPACPPESS